MHVMCNECRQMRKMQKCTRRQDRLRGTPYSNNVRRDHLTMDISDDEKRTDHTFVDSELSHWLHLSG